MQAPAKLEHLYCRINRIFIRKRCTCHMERPGLQLAVRTQVRATCLRRQGSGTAEATLVDRWQFGEAWQTDGRLARSAIDAAKDASPWHHCGIESGRRLAQQLPCGQQQSSAGHRSIICNSGMTNQRRLWKKCAQSVLTFPDNPAMDSPNHNLRVDDVRRRFDRAAATFESADFVHKVTREGLLARIEPMAVEARTVVDLGAATGSATPALRKRFRRSHIVAVDLSAAMLEQTRSKKSWFTRMSALQADAAAIPLADNSVDVVFANLLLPWLNDPPGAFVEINRVLREEGLFVFSTLGPDSLLALRKAWRTVDDDEHVNRFADMHNIGDALVRSGLRDPVLDVDRLSVTYENPRALFRDLTGAGARNSLAGRRRSLTGKRRYAAMTRALLASESGEPLTLDLEIVYGHCWAGPVRPDGGVFGVDAGRIPVRRR